MSRLRCEPCAAGDGRNRAEHRHPDHQRPRRLGTCIASLVAQESLAGRLELIVVVDGPDSATEQMLGSLTPPFPLRVIVQDHSGRRPRGIAEPRTRGAVTFSSSTTTSWSRRGSSLRTSMRCDRAITWLASGGSKRCCPRVLRAGLGRVRRSGGTITTASPPAASRGSATPMAGTCPYGATTSSRCEASRPIFPSSTMWSSAIGSLERE